jgi:hypothetical protein
MTDWENTTADELRAHTANNPHGEDLAGMAKEEKVRMFAAVRRISKEEQAMPLSQREKDVLGGNELMNETRRRDLLFKLAYAAAAVYALIWLFG